jgi:hypothetical protein
MPISKLELIRSENCAAIGEDSTVEEFALEWQGRDIAAAQR